MRWAIAAACLSVLAIGVAILVATPEMDRLPSGGRAIPYLGIVLAWGFVGVGAFAWARRPDNRTGMLMTIVGLVTAVSGLQLFDEPVPYVLGSLADTTTAALLVHLLLAFPSGRLEGRAARRVVALGYIAAALQLPLVLVTDCTDDGCPENLLLVTDNATVATVVASVQGVLGLVAVVAAVVLVLRRWRTSSPAQRRGLEPVLLLGAAILVLGLAFALTQAADLDASKPLQIAFFSAFALLPAAFLVGLVRTRFFHTATVARLIEQLTRDPRGVREALAAALGDPSLEVAYWLSGGYVTRDGRPLAEPEPGQC